MTRPEANLILRAYREAYRDPPADDLPDPTVITDAVDVDGTVLRVRGLSWSETLALLERDCRGDVT